MPKEIFRQYESASWTVGGRTITFPVQAIHDEMGNRLVKRERAYRNGAKVDDTGSRAREWSFDCIFNNTLTVLSNGEPGLAANGMPLYPDAVNVLAELFDVHETGDLVVPTIGGTVRARAESMSRIERSDQRDTAIVTLRFVADNEDNVDQASYQSPSVSASAQQIADAAEFEEQSNDMWDGSIQDLNELASQLEGIANAPGDYMQDVETQAGIVMGAVDKVVAAWSSVIVTGRDALLDADGNNAERKLQAQKELAGKARQVPARGRPRVVTKVYTTKQSIFTVAVDVGQEASTLLTINPQLEDPLQIPAGTGVRILADA